MGGTVAGGLDDQGLRVAFTGAVRFTNGSITGGFNNGCVATANSNDFTLSLGSTSACKTGSTDHGGNLSLTNLNIYSVPLNTALPTITGNPATLSNYSNIFTITSSNNSTGTRISYPPEALNARVHRCLLATGSATGLGTIGDTFGSAGTLADVPTAGSEPEALSFTTSGAAGNVAGLTGGLTSLPGRNIWWSGYASINASTNFRHFMGISSTSLTTQGGNDTVASQTYAGFLVSTGLTHTNDYYCIINNNNATAPVPVDSTVTIGSAGHKLDIREDSVNSNWYFYIDGVSVCGSPIGISLSTASVMRQMGLITEVSGTATKAMNFSWGEVWSDK
jgi:hypothetical protein